MHTRVLQTAQSERAGKLAVEHAVCRGAANGGCKLHKCLCGFGQRGGGKPDWHLLFGGAIVGRAEAKSSWHWFRCGMWQSCMCACMCVATMVGPWRDGRNPGHSCKMATAESAAHVQQQWPTQHSMQYETTVCNCQRIAGLAVMYACLNRIAAARQPLAKGDQTLAAVPRQGGRTGVGACMQMQMPGKRSAACAADCSRTQTRHARL